MAQTPTAFISYRRDDSQDVSGRIYDHLEARFGARQVVKDVDSFQPGADFRLEIDRLIASCDVLLAVIGPNWAGATGLPGQRRIDRPDDFVRIELELALRRAIPIIPLLVSDATMPSPEALPAALAPLAYRNALRVRADPDFRRDMDRVIAGIEVNAREAREAREARQRERQRASKPAPTLAGPGPSAATPLAAQATVDAPLLPETSARGAPAAPRPRAPRAAASPLRRNSKGILAVAAALLLIAFSTLGLQAFLSGQDKPSAGNNLAETHTAETQTATAGIATAAAAFRLNGYSTKTPGACDTGGGRWSSSPNMFGGYESRVTCTTTSSTLTGDTSRSADHGSSSLAAMDFYGVGGGTTTFPTNYQVSVQVAGLHADACIALYTRVLSQIYGTVLPQGYGFNVCQTSAEINGASNRPFTHGNWGSPFTLGAKCFGNHLTLLIDGASVLTVDDSTYTTTNFLEIRIDSSNPNSSTTVASATLSNFVFMPIR